MIEKFSEYISSIINLTCGFKVEVKVIELSTEAVQVVIEGTPEERALVMGREGRNIQAFTRLAHIFARRHNYFVYVYVKPKPGSEVDDLSAALNKI